MNCVVYLSLLESSSWNDSSSEEQYQFKEDEDIAVLMVLHMEKNNGQSMAVPLFTVGDS